MKRRPAPTDPARWRETNPDYRPGGVRRVRINGVECVEFDAGKWWDYRRDQELMSKRGRR
jgi:hypothetical protein